jgi:dihydroflavonol-4-reductase
MKILVVGGTGMVGASAALRLKSLGHDVTIAARKPSSTAAGQPLGELPFVAVDYIEVEPDLALLSRFDALVFTAGNDVRHLPSGGNESAHWQRANAISVPRYFAAAKQAGVKQAVLIGSFYPQAAPYLVAKNPYVASRLAADEGVRKLASDEFKVVVLNAPFIVGEVPGAPVPAYRGMAAWALGLLPQMPRYTIAGGVNVISTTTLTDAIVGALERGQNGKAYLIGDENLTFQDFFGLYFKAAGDDKPLEILDQEHPFLPDAAIYAGRGNTIYYDPDPAEVAELGYRRHDVTREIQTIVDAARAGR